MQIIPVGIILKSAKSSEHLKKIFRRRVIEDSLVIPNVYDSTLYKAWNVEGTPTIFILSPNNIIKWSTSSITPENIQDIISGKEPTLVPQFVGKLSQRKNIENQYDFNKPLLIDDNGGSNGTWIYRSMLTNWARIFPLQKIISTSNTIDFLGFDIRTLYKLSAWGKATWTAADKLYNTTYPDPILELKDTTIWNKLNYLQHLYSYSISHPNIESNAVELTRIEIHNDRLKHQIRTDLDNIFSYKSTIEKRTFHCYKLICFSPSAAEKLRSVQNTSPTFDFDYTGGFTAKNQPSLVIPVILERSYNHPNSIFLDESNIKFKIDVSFSSMSFPEIVNELANYGLTLKEDKIEMDALIISE